jgi:hypothetical protein
MTPIITIDKLQLFLIYDGDVDGIVRGDNNHKHEALDSDMHNVWAIIESKLQDINLISKRLTAPAYIAKILNELNEICDEKSFKTLTSRINFYANFQLIAEILLSIKSKINAETDTVWAGFTSVDIFLKELNEDIENIKFCNFSTLDKINIEFAVTSTYQELAMSNGWSDEYLKLADKFDKIYGEIIKSNII